MCLSVSPCASLNMHMPSMECGGQRTTPGISTHLPSCLRQDLLFAVAYCQTSWSLSIWGSPACTRILLYDYRYYRHALLRPAEHGFWGVNSGPHDRVVSVLLTEPSLSPAQIFRSGQDHFQPTVSRYSRAHHCNHLVLVLHGRCESECGGVNRLSISLLGKAPSLGAWTC